MTPLKRIYAIAKTKWDKDDVSEQSELLQQKVLKWSNPLPKDSEWWQTLVEAIGNFIIIMWYAAIMSGGKH